MGLPEFFFVFQAAGLCRTLAPMLNYLAVPFLRQLGIPLARRLLASRVLTQTFKYLLNTYLWLNSLAPRYPSCNTVR